MAKFSRHDPRNKKQNRNKQRSIEKDLRIHEERKAEKYQNWEDMYEEDDAVDSIWTDPPTPLEDQPSFEPWDD